MPTLPDRLPRAPRELAQAVLDGLTAARAADSEAMVSATDRLGLADPAQVRVVLGSVLRTLLEERHADGLDADDARTAAADALRVSAPWAQVDPQALLAVLLGALGVTGDDPSEAGGQPVPPPQELAVAWLALVVSLSSGPGLPAEEHLALALAEVERSETVEQP